MRLLLPDKPRNYTFFIHFRIGCPQTIPIDVPPPKLSTTAAHVVEGHPRRWFVPKFWLRFTLLPHTTYAQLFLCLSVCSMTQNLCQGKPRAHGCAWCDGSNGYNIGGAHRRQIQIGRIHTIYIYIYLWACEHAANRVRYWNGRHKAHCGLTQRCYVAICDATRLHHTRHAGGFFFYCCDLAWIYLERNYLII